jgi:hypothetical protein
VHDTPPAGVVPDGRPPATVPATCERSGEVTAAVMGAAPITRSRAGKPVLDGSFAPYPPFVHLPQRPRDKNASYAQGMSEI